MNCEHEKEKIVELKNEYHKGKVICANADCGKFLRWYSFKSVQQRSADRKRHIKAYYDQHPELDKYKTPATFKRIGDMDYAFD